MTGKSAKRQAALRARRANIGIHEVRGIWAPKERHAAIIEAAQTMVRPDAVNVTDVAALANARSDDPAGSTAPASSGDT